MVIKNFSSFFWRLFVLVVEKSCWKLVEIINWDWGFVSLDIVLFFNCRDVWYILIVVCCIYSYGNVDNFGKLVDDWCWLVDGD